MQITTEHREGQAALVAITGEMNIYHALDGKAALMKALGSVGDIDLDLSGVNEFDSAGLQLLILAFRETERRGSRMRLSAKSEQVGNVMGIFRLNEFFGATGHGA